MKYQQQLIVLACLALFLTACGESTTDEPLPDGTAPSDAPVDREVEPQPDPEAPDPTPAVDEPGTTTPPPLPVPESDAERLSIPGLTYALPEGWTVGPEKAMRLLTLLPPDGGGAQLAVSRWPGDVGGFAMNVGRWCSQAGLPLPAADFSSPAASGYEQFDIDGTTATWIPLMNEDANVAILVAWVPMGDDPETPDQTWTFKLTCSADQVQTLAPGVRAWCESIEFED